jgi:hypothetical protein
MKFPRREELPSVLYDEEMGWPKNEFPRYDKNEVEEDLQPSIHLVNFSANRKR